MGDGLIHLREVCYPHDMTGWWACNPNRTASPSNSTWHERNAVTCPECREHLRIQDLNDEITARARATGNLHPKYYDTPWAAKVRAHKAKWDESRKTEMPVTITLESVKQSLHKYAKPA